MPAPYPIVQDCTNLAAVRLNDAMQQAPGAPAGQIGGEVTGNQQIFSQTVVNGAWQKFQEYLANQNFSRLINTVILSGISPVAVTDPGVNCFIDWDGYFNGSTVNPAITLPDDFTTPLRMKERVHGQTGLESQFTPMEYIVNGLTGNQKGNRNYNWAWDDDHLLFPGSLQTMDFEVRYIRFLDDFQDVGSPVTTHWYQQPVPILRSKDALAWYIVFEYSNGRGDMDSAAILAQAEAAALKLVSRETQNENLRSEWVIPAIPQASGATHYDTVNTILNVVKTRLNALSKGQGDITVTNQPFMQQCTNTAYRKFQAFLANLGYIKFTKEIELDNLAPKTSPDPAVQVSLDWSGYNNGSVLDTTLVLPEDLILPTVLWERPTGQNALFNPMNQWLDGLPTIAPVPFNRIWEWRGDTIYMPGALTALDMRIRYANYLPDLIETAGPTLQWYEQTVPIVRAQDALSLFICAEIASSRPDLEMDTAAFTKAGEDAARLIYNRDVRQKQRVNVRRQSRSGRLEGSWYGYGYGTW